MHLFILFILTEDHSFKKYIQEKHLELLACKIYYSNALDRKEKKKEFLLISIKKYILKFYFNMDLWLYVLKVEYNLLLYLEEKCLKFHNLCVIQHEVGI